MMDSVTHRVNDPPASLGAPGLAAAARRILLATRPAFFTAAVLPVIVGTAWAGAVMHRFDATLLVLSLLATVFAHAATNVYNDVGDDINGTDPGNDQRIYPYTGGSRFIQCGLLSRSAMLRVAIAFAIAAVAIGVVLSILRGPDVIWLGLLGLLLGLLYSMPGIQLSARGLGELAVAIGLGALPLLGTIWLQAGRIDAEGVLISLPISAWVAAILVINEVPDLEPDKIAGKRTLVVRFGVRGAREIYRGLTIFAAVAAALSMLVGALPWWHAFAAGALAAAGFWAAAGISARSEDRVRLTKSIQATLAIHTLGGVAMVVAIIGHRFA